MRLRLALWPAAIALGVAAEWIGRPEAAGLDAAAGFGLVGLGLAAWMLRDCRAAAIMVAGGVAWFLGSFGGWTVFLHRGPLAHLLAAYPSGSLRSRADRVAIAAAYAYAAVYPVARNDWCALVYAAGLAALCAYRFLYARGRERRARAAALAGALVFGAVIATAALLRLTGAGGGRPLLWTYDLVVLLVAVGLFALLMWGRSSTATVTGLVVDLGDPRTATRLGDRLARALGDPTLAIAYALPDGDGFVDETGRRVELPAGRGDRAITPIEEDGRRVAVLVHDAAVLDDPALVSAVSAATRLAVSNASLQADVRARVAEVEASRRRIVEAADAQRLRLEQELREGAERRLARVADLLAGEPALAELSGSVEVAREELRQFALGIHPGSLVAGGLAAALGELAERAHVEVDVSVPAERFPAGLEAAAYFVCSEALTNAEKHAEAARVTIRLSRDEERVVLRIEDDGVGGADPSRGSGLQGLADRVEALGGRLTLVSPDGRGTRLVVELPA